MAIGTPRRRRSDLPDDAGRVPDGEDAGREVAIHHRTGSDDGVFADCDSGQNDGAPAQPNVGRNGYGLARLPFGSTGFWVEGMGGSEELNVGPDLDVVADGDGGNIESHQAEVHERPVADPDLPPVIAVEGRPNLALSADGTEKLIQDSAPLIVVLGRGLVERILKASGTKGVGHDLRIVGPVELACQHPLALGRS